VLLKRSNQIPLVKAFDPKHPSDTTDRNDSFLEQNEIDALPRKAKKLVVLTGSQLENPCQSSVQIPLQRETSMKVPNKRKPKPQLEPWAAPFMAYPEQNKVVGPATLLLGSGIPNAGIEVWSSDEKQLHAKGKINKNGRWAFSTSGDLSLGTCVIKARQTYEDVDSVWTDDRTFEVDVEAAGNVPAIAEPREGQELGKTVILKGDVPVPHGMVDLFDLIQQKWITYALVDENGQWTANEAVVFPAGKQQVSAIHRVGGKISDWARVRTFTVTATRQGKHSA
jgi:hypothetical protein